MTAREAGGAGGRAQPALPRYLMQINVKVGLQVLYAHPVGW